ncbi:MAG TPA: hypothetical protein VIN08_15015 [Ohtaekwangia sp.]|uniref:hypothetical protein n=1 Tax=Ohtaekwangia sp. TaxID=2066019 RepID=UPI002F92BA63
MNTYFLQFMCTTRHFVQMLIGYTSSKISTEMEESFQIIIWVAWMARFSGVFN